MLTSENVATPAAAAACDLPERRALRTPGSLPIARVTSPVKLVTTFTRRVEHGDLHRRRDAACVFMPADSGCKRRTASAPVPRASSGSSVRTNAATCGVEATGVSRALRVLAFVSHFAGASQDATAAPVAGSL